MTNDLIPFDYKRTSLKKYIANRFGTKAAKMFMSDGSFAFNSLLAILSLVVSIYFMSVGSIRIGIQLFIMTSILFMFVVEQRILYFIVSISIREADKIKPKSKG